MKQLSKKEKEKILNRIFWDMNIGLAEIDRILSGAPESRGEKIENSIYRRLLLSCDWYTLLKLVPEKKLLQMLTTPVIQSLYPKDLQSRFSYARDVLSRHPLYCEKISF